MGPNIQTLLRDAQSGAGSREIETSLLLSMLDEIFQRGFYIQAMEVFEADDEGFQTANIELGLLGLEGGFDAKAPLDEQYAKGLAEKKLRQASKLANSATCIFWVDKLQKT